MRQSASNTTNSTRTFMPSPQHEAEPPKKSKKIRGNAKLRMPAVGARTIVWMLLVVVVIIAVFFAVQYRRSQGQLAVTNDGYYARQTERLGALILLPSDEVPTIITVKDASKLKGQAFYVNAQNGDLVFAYKKAQKAILYRPSQNIIVNVSPVTITAAAPARA